MHFKRNNESTELFVKIVRPYGWTSFDSTEGRVWESALPQQAKFTFPGHIFTHFGFSECRCCLQCNIYSRLSRAYGLMLLDKRMPDFRLTDILILIKRKEKTVRHPLLHIHIKAGNKCYTQDNTDARENPKCVKRW